MRAPPTTLEILDAWAQREPARIALVEEGASLDYRSLANMLLQCGRHLSNLGVRKGQRVAISGPGFGIQLVLLFACEALGAVTLSFQAEGDADADFVFTHADWVISARPQAVPAGVKFVLVDQALLRRLATPFEGEEPAWSPADWHEPARITRTSGSTGASKFMVLRRSAQERWGAPPLGVQYDPRTRLLMLGPLVMNGILGRSSYCLRAGGTLLVGHGRDIVRMNPTHIYGLPLHVERLLAELPAGYVPPRPVAVSSGGGLAPAQLRQRVQAIFGTWLTNRYASNEVHAICDELDADATGTVAAGVQLRILDAQGQPLPQGQEGTIAVRTPAMADGYLDRPEETAAVFRDGWFITSDVGVLVARRRLRLLGRHDDLVNIGGIKLPAAQLEQRLRAQPAIADAAVLAVNLQGVSLGVALVLAAGATQEEAAAQMQQALQVAEGTGVRVVFVDELPRMQTTGKLDRMGLLRALRG